MKHWADVTKRKPKMLTKVMVCCKDCWGKSRITFAEYVPKKRVLAADYLDENYEGELSVDGETEYAPSGWYEIAVFHDINMFVSDDVTHWQELPEMPGGAVLPKQTIKKP